MFGKIIKLSGNKIIVENASGLADTNYIGYHVVFAETDHKIVGEIVAIDSKIIEIQLIGEISADGIFSNGVLKKPGGKTIARFINQN